MIIERTKMTFGEFLARLEKFPKWKAIFRPDKPNVEHLTSDMLGTVTVISTDDRVIN